MADETQSVPEGGRRDSFAKQLSNAAAKKALAPLAAAAATAGTTYLMRKASEIWQARLLPMLEEKGGGQAVAKEALEKFTERLGGKSPDALSGLSERLSDEAQPTAKASAEKQEQAKAEAGVSEPDSNRDQERKARQQRRQKRQRALEQSGST